MTTKAYPKELKEKHMAKDVKTKWENDRPGFGVM